MSRMEFETADAVCSSGAASLCTAGEMELRQPGSDAAARGMKLQANDETIHSIFAELT